MWGENWSRVCLRRALTSSRPHTRDSPPSQTAQYQGPCPPRPRYPSWSTENRLRLCVFFPKVCRCICVCVFVSLCLRAVSVYSGFSSRSMCWSQLGPIAALYQCQLRTSGREGECACVFKSLNLYLRPQQWGVTLSGKNNPVGATWGRPSHTEGAPFHLFLLWFTTQWETLSLSQTHQHP